MPKAVYAGSFDPFTLGHLHIYNKAIEVFDDVIVLIANNSQKKRFTNKLQMKEMISKATKCGTVVIYDGYVADYCREGEIRHLVRSLRNPNYYAYEEQIAKVNMELFAELETIYFRAKDDVIPSSLVRDFYMHGKKVEKYLPKEVKIITDTAPTLSLL